MALSVARFSLGPNLLSPLRQALFEFTAKQGMHSRFSKTLLAERRIQAVRANRRAWIESPKRFDKLQRQPRSRMHRHVVRDPLRLTYRRLIQRLPGKIEAYHVVPALPQPRRGRRQPERLPPQLIRRYQNDVHAFLSIAAQRLDSFSVMIEVSRAD